MNILVLNGPNLNMLGIREPQIYGTQDYAALEAFIHEAASALDCAVVIRQSNHEGVLIDWIQDAYGKYDAIVMNPGGYTHTSVAILDAIQAVSLPTVEVHLSDPDQREAFRRVSLLREACVATFKGHGFDSYRLALQFLANKTPAH